MFSKQASSQLKKEFWTAFGLYMKPVPFAEGEKTTGLITKQEKSTLPLGWMQQTGKLLLQ